MVRMAKANLIGITVLVATLLIEGTGIAEIKGPVKPSKKDKCPVCGMFVYKYPDWLAQIIFKDGDVDFFDGTKDMFKYYFDIEKYRKGKSRKDISDIFITEYYGMKFIPASDAFFVIGSEVYGPMGRELIPLENEADAKVFLKDHKGMRILRFGEITPKVIEKLD
ncbi:MAG: nitrous oxide reductase accessory protein NosL [Desulfobacteraceae bacterium]|nr:MAG: nitrous oxide reductase accessory protein NosL [Desulfobacteraceae bacterium]